VKQGEGPTEVQRLPNQVHQDSGKELGEGKHWEAI
jgi:hypothetical protein